MAMQQAQSQQSSTSPVGCLGWSSFVMFVALALYLLFRLWSITGFIYGFGMFSVVLLLVFIVKAQKNRTPPVDNSLMYFPLIFLFVATCAVFGITGMTSQKDIPSFPSDEGISLRDYRPKVIFYSDWIRVFATESLNYGDTLPASNTVRENSLNNKAESILDLPVPSFSPSEWERLVNHWGSVKNFLNTYGEVGGFGTATILLWLILIVGAIAIGRSALSAIRALLVLLAASVGIFASLWAHQHLGLFAWILTANDMLLLSTALALAISLVAFATTITLTANQWPSSDLLVSVSGLLWVGGLTILAIISDRSPTALGILAVIWLLLMFGAARFHGTRKWSPWTPKLALSRNRPNKNLEGTMGNERSKTRQEYVIISDAESRQYQPNLDALIDDQIDASDPHKQAPFYRGDIRIYRSYLLDLFRRIRIKECRPGVLICNGRAVRVLNPGAYHVLSFPWFQKIELRIFDGRRRKKDVEADGITLFYESPFTGTRIPLNVSMEIVVRYQISNPIGTFQYEDPVGEIRDKAAEAMRAVVLRASYETFKGGESIGGHICTRLQEDASITSMGIAVLEVQVLKLEGDVSFDATIRAEDLAVRNPDIQKFLKPEQYAILRKIEQEEGRDIASTIVDMARILKPSQVQAIFSEFLESRQARSKIMPILPAAPIATPVLPAEPQTTHERLQDDMTRLAHQGVSARLMKSAGAGLLRVVALFPDAGGTPIKIELDCPEDYPHQAPAMRVERGGQVESFTPDALRHWAADSSLVTLVEAARKAFE